MMTLLQRAAIYRDLQPGKYIHSAGVVIRANNGDVYAIAKNEQEALRVQGLSGIYGKPTVLTPKTPHLSLHLAFLGATGLLDKDSWGKVYSILQG